MTPSAPLLRFSVLCRDREGAFVTLRLEESLGGHWKNCGILTIEPETFEELMMTLELGSRKTGLQVEVLR